MKKQAKQDLINYEQAGIKRQQKGQLEPTFVAQQVKIEQEFNINPSKTKIKTKRKDRTEQTNLPDPDQQDLCKALTLLRTKLPNRSLLQTIKRLYQTVQQKQQSSACSQQSSNNTIEGERTEKPDVSVKSSRKGRSEADPSPFKKASPYHNKIGPISAISHQFYNTRIQKQTNFPIISNEPFIKQFQAEPERRSVTFHFKQQNTLKTHFLNPLQQQKYKQRRQLTQIYIERGYGVTKQIDEQLPSIGIQRNKYKNLLGGVLTMAYRKLQSFLFSECHKTIKYINRQQMKSIATMLLNCRVQLSPTMCDTYFKFMRVGFGLGDVDISDEEAVELYVGIHKFIQGKNVTMEMLENMGRVQNLRELQATTGAKAERLELQVRQGYSNDLGSYSMSEKSHSINRNEVKEQHESVPEQQPAALPSIKVGINCISSLEDNEQLIDLRNIVFKHYHEDRAITHNQQADQTETEDTLFLLEAQIDPSFLNEINF